jgi:23S rRNA pseudouridine1911/1915/1917 synthase
VTVVLLPPVPTDILPEPIPLDVLYEDDDLIVINKRAGIIVHPANRITSGTLVNALLYHCKRLSGVGGVVKPGIVHRLDKGTSGCLVVAKNDAAHVDLNRQFAARSVRKVYFALVHGVLKHDQGLLEGLIARHPVQRKKMSVRHDAGRTAETAYRVIERFEESSHIEVRLKTGRTHQIRVHMAHLGHPVIGDSLYAPKKPTLLRGVEVKRPMLHAWRLGFVHPGTGKPMRFEAPVPEDINELLSALRMHR